ncbi:MULTISPECIES: DUF397 domain-containing protein [Actinopolyspora]|uniref:DUF397 domain-containing protein n=1 Tax=Actinopolyspora saharensis TaxID=995062 RepID=A0A1H0ZVW8_9ACTN|nr:DUF397 domain-containing protein [Actinopolyspora saharensis]NHD15554.1 DUF397 domain-containing protein [Actinopolyspora sp. BKK2]NHE75232.1 DUF397 domain-containing protein [Actinopolyspora sp. BKK1]SDQ31499.1 protein of unknown function [Actinopolyspora saharensis]
MDTVTNWRKSSRSSSQANCVEVAFTEHGIATRDSKHPHGDSLLFPRARWNDFLRSLDHAHPGT